MKRPWAYMRRHLSRRDKKGEHEGVTTTFQGQSCEVGECNHAVTAACSCSVVDQARGEISAGSVRWCDKSQDLFALRWPRSAVVSIHRSYLTLTHPPAYSGRAQRRPHASASLTPHAAGCEHSDSAAPSHSEPRTRRHSHSGSPGAPRHCRVRIGAWAPAGRPEGSARG